MVWPKKLYPVGMEAITSRKTRNIIKRKRKVYLIEKNEKKSEQWRDKKNGSQPVNNSLASFRHQRGKISTDPRLTIACTNSCG